MKEFMVLEIFFYVGTLAVEKNHEEFVRTQKAPSQCEQKIYNFEKEKERTNIHTRTHTQTQAQVHSKRTTLSCLLGIVEP